jgi:hypothetical protein
MKNNFRVKRRENMGVAVAMLVSQWLVTERGCEKELNCEKVSGATAIDPLVTTQPMTCNLKLILNKWSPNSHNCVLFVGLFVDLLLHHSSECFEFSEETLRLPGTKSCSTARARTGINLACSGPCVQCSWSHVVISQYYYHYPLPPPH